MSDAIKDLRTYQAWCKGGRVLDEPNNSKLIMEFLSRNQFPVTFATINAAAGSSELQGKLKWHRAPSDNFEQVITRWIKTLPAEFHKGLGKALGDSLGNLIESDYDNVYTIDNLNNAWERIKHKLFRKPEEPPKPEPSNESKTDELVGQGGRKLTGLKNHAAENDASAPPDDRQISANIQKFLQSVAGGGHLKLAQSVQTQAAEEIKAGTPWSEVNANARARVIDALADLAITKLLQDAPGGNNFSKAASRQHLVDIVQQGLRDGMSKADIAKIVKMESDAQQERSIR